MTEKRTPPTILDHSDEEEARIQRAIAEDPDTWEAKGPVVRRPTPDKRVGRPCGSNKVQVTMRLDKDVIEALKTPDAEGWQTRANALLRRATGV